MFVPRGCEEIGGKATRSAVNEAVRPRDLIGKPM